MTAPTNVGYLAAFGGGLVSFLSPCVLPIVPAYLSVITGLDIAELEHGNRHQQRRIARDTTLFILGFAAVSSALGLTATTLGHALLRSRTTLTRLSGPLVLSFALFLLGSLVRRAPWLYQEKRFHPTLSRFDPFAAPIAGAAFGFGWTPCIGPVLGSVLALAATRGNAVQGVGLLAGAGVHHLSKNEEGRHGVDTPLIDREQYASRSPRRDRAARGDRFQEEGRVWIDDHAVNRPATSSSRRRAPSR